MRKAAAAWAAGSTVVAKAPSETPFSSLAFAVLCERAGLPKGVYNIITSKTSSIIGKALCEHPLVKKISFTGSTNVGKTLMGLSASTLKKCSFELGGNAPFIVFEDADLDKAVESAAAVKFRCSGQVRQVLFFSVPSPCLTGVTQVCISVNRILVQDSIHDEFVRKLAARVKQFRVGYWSSASLRLEASDDSFD